MVSLIQNTIPYHSFHGISHAHGILPWYFTMVYHGLHVSKHHGMRLPGIYTASSPASGPRSRLDLGRVGVHSSPRTTIVKYRLRNLRTSARVQ